MAPSLRAAPGDLYVSDYANNLVVKYSPAGTKIVLASGLNGPRGLAFDNKANVFVVELGGGTVLKFTPGGTRSVFASGFTNPQGLTIDSAGNLFVAETAGTISKITPAGVKTPFASGLGSAFGLACDKAGNVYEADNYGGTVFKFSPAGIKAPFATGLGDPLALAFDSAGNLFVSSPNAGTITKITPGGIKITFASGLNQPYGLAFDSNGNLLVTENGSPSNILLITPAGAKSTFIPNTGGAFLAFEPVLHQLLNISTRAFVQTGDGALIAGFILGGNGDANTTVVARAIGPSLAAFGVPNTLQDPTLELRDGAGALVAQDDDWKIGGQQAQIQATGLAPGNDREAALLASLPAGNYTVVVRGFNNTTGNGLVEVYNLQ